MVDTISTKNFFRLPIYGLKFFLIISFTIGLLGCTSGRYDAPVSQRQQPPSIKIKRHVVSTGETLYYIAWRYGYDYKALANANGLRYPYTIYPGQKLLLRESKYAPRVGSGKPSSTPKEVVTRPLNRPRNTPKSSAKPTVVGDISWRWPASGKVIKAFSPSSELNKGIDIAGKMGEPVRTAASGQVVYAGSGILGYGLLLIVKHNDRFLSAYAHNSRLVVKEGDYVTAGQKIAEIGSSGTTMEKLHFEIRREGKPVDPVRYLPKR